MGNITETDYFENLQRAKEKREYAEDTMQEDEKLVYEAEHEFRPSLPYKSHKDKCTVCNEDSLYEKTMPIDLRLGYIEGSGQLCLECYDKVYNKKANDE